MLNHIKNTVAISIILFFQTLSAQSIQRVGPSSIVQLKEIEANWTSGEFQVDSVAANGSNWCVLSTSSGQKLSSPIWSHSAHCLIDGRKGMIQLPIGSTNLEMIPGSLRFKIKNTSGKVDRYQVSLFDVQKAMSDRQAIHVKHLTKSIEGRLKAGAIEEGRQMDLEPEVVQSHHSFQAANGDTVVIHGTTERIFRFNPDGSLKTSIDMQLDSAFSSLGYNRVKKHPADSGLTRFAHAWSGPNETILLFLIGVPFMGETPIAAVDLHSGQVREIATLETPKRIDRNLVGGPQDFTFFSFLVQGKELIAASKEGTLAFYPIEFSLDQKR